MPIPIEKLRALKHIVVHESCPDGSASAMILKLCLPEADVRFVQYDTPEHKVLEARPGTVFADFSPWWPGLGEDPTDEELRTRELAKERLKTHVQAGAIVLDHHKTQQEVVDEFGELGVFGDGKTEPGVCGATLAFREVWQYLAKEQWEKDIEDNNLNTTPDSWSNFKATIEDLGKLAGIRDTWQTKDPRWREACEQAAALHFWPDNILFDTPPERWHSKLELGSVLFQQKLDLAKKRGDNAFRFTSDAGTRVAIFEGSGQASDAAEYLDKEVDLIIGFDVFMSGGKPVMLFSIRSHTDFDCAAIAKSHGGGGHLRAAGFKWLLQPEDPHPFSLAQKVLNAYERTQSENKPPEG